GLVVSVDGNPITSGASVEAGKTVSVDSSAVSGRDIDSATLNGDPISGADAGVFTFTMPSQNSVLLIEWIDN
ncbi:hypothetical protein, partial [Fibrobacter sp.]